MKSKIRSMLILLLFIFSIVLIESCYTKKKGVVPCPTWGQVDNIQNQNLNQIPVSE